MNKTHLLDVQRLCTYYFTKQGVVKAVDGVSFQIDVGDCLGIAGESGSGKSTSALSIVKLLPPSAKITEGKVLFQGEDLAKKSESQMKKQVRWKKISIVFQGTSGALNPLMKIGDQITEAILWHEHANKVDALKRAKELLELTAIDQSRANNYPFEFSGGMNQRVMIAMALACHPNLLIADEPTTALDVIIQAQIIKLVKDLQEKLKLSIMWITHDLSVLSQVCNRLAIMYSGKIVEYGNALSFFKKPMHPYSQALINAFPKIKGPKISLDTVWDAPPDFVCPSTGCRFYPRCQNAKDICRTNEPEMVQVDTDHYVSCHLADK